VFFHVSITFCFGYKSSSVYPCYFEIRQLKCVLLVAVPGGNLKAQAVPLIKGREHLTPLCHEPQQFPMVSWVGFKVMALTFINLNGLDQLISAFSPCNTPQMKLGKVQIESVLG